MIFVLAFMWQQIFWFLAKQDQAKQELIVTLNQYFAAKVKWSAKRVGGESIHFSDELIVMYY